MINIHTLDELISRHEGHITVACDTEFKGPHTLTIQFAARLGEDVVVQVYSSPAVPGQPDPEELTSLLSPQLLSHCGQVVIRDGRELRADLSPADVLGHLCGRRGVEAMDRFGGDGADPGPDGDLTVTLVGHFWTADFFRIFGRDFFGSLVEHQMRGGRLVIDGGKLLSFKEAGQRWRVPVLGYALEGTEDGRLYTIRVNYFDTNLAFGFAKLDELARTFVGVGKLEGFDEAAKADMLATFRRDPHRAYAYAVQDVILTLLVQERMAVTHREMYRNLGFKDDIPAIRPTLGSRVAEMIVWSVARDAGGSVELPRKGKKLTSGGAVRVSPAKVKALLKKGSGAGIAEGALSQFAEQTGQTHGGLLFSRSPTKLFHEAPGMLHDVDLSGCYANIMGSMRLYAGRPVVHEPGRAKSGRIRMTLKEAVDFVTEHAARDAWVVKVSGPITTFPNVLVPSTRHALTNGNFKSRAARRRAKASPHQYGFAFDRLDEDGPDEGNTSIYTDVIQAGVIAWPTWLMIQALPQEWRAEYEGLEVDSVLFYPEKLVADTGPAFDALVQLHSHEGTPWTATIDLERLVQTIKRRIDDEYVSLRFDLGSLARSILAKRKEAKDKHGKGSAAELGWKLTGNTLYGVVASPHMATNNVVAANVITATARALAFAMQMSLNGIQVITDGCNYRRDQIPAGTFAEGLAACPDYPINRAGFSGPFLDPVSVPQDDAGFTDWYRGHVKRFFGVTDPEYDRLFGLHSLEHKKTAEDDKDAPVAFDALACDGASNYVKLLRDDAGKWKPADFKARSFPRKAKEAISEWLVRAYTEDRYDGPPPVVEATTLLSYKAAGRVARKALKALPIPTAVYYPLGLEQRRVQVYKVLKGSGFLFRTPRQQAAFVRAMAKFAEVTSCGLEALALRRSGEGRRKGSLADIAATLYRLIREGVQNPTKALNLTRLCGELEQVQEQHHLDYLARKIAAERELHRKIDARRLDEATILTGLFVCLEDIFRLTES
jgi:hypothetical protein